jgi:hypothetical protein
LKQIGQGLAHCGVIVDHNDNGCGFAVIRHYNLPVALAGSMN